MEGDGHPKVKIRYAGHVFSRKKTVEPCQVCPPHGLESTRSSSSTCLLKFATLRAHIRCLARQIRQQHANMAPGTMMNIPKKECVYIYYGDTHLHPWGKILQGQQENVYQTKSQLRTPLIVWTGYLHYIVIEMMLPCFAKNFHPSFQWSVAILNAG